MATDDQTTRDNLPQALRPVACQFSVRLWKEDLADGSHYRGSVRDARTNAFRGFRDWSDLVAFMVARVEQDESGQSGRAADDFRHRTLTVKPSTGDTP